MIFFFLEKYLYTGNFDKMRKIFAPSELILDQRGYIYHLHLKPGDIADRIILVGDPERVPLVSSFFDTLEIKKQNREFVTHTGFFRKKRVSVLSTGIGTDNIDIVMNELDALVNIDFDTRTLRKERKSLTLVRIGTSGALQKDIPLNSFLLSRKVIGFDGMMHFYAGLDRFNDNFFVNSFIKEVNWPEIWNTPYVLKAPNDLADKMSGTGVIEGITISAPGFYGPQGRTLRIPVADTEMNNKIKKFLYQDEKITNYEMESSALYGLSGLLGHKAVTLCAIIANRETKEANHHYEPLIKRLIEYVLIKLTA